MTETLSIGTPALLFPAISLLLLAYTNRFLGLATVVRQLHRDFLADPQPSYRAQIRNLRWRIQLIRLMQVCGVLSILLCTVCMFQIFHGWSAWVNVTFQASLVAMMVSLGLSLWEIGLSVGALDVHLCAMEEDEPGK